MAVTSDHVAGCEHAALAQSLVDVGEELLEAEDMVQSVICHDYRELARYIDVVEVGFDRGRKALQLLALKNRPQSIQQDWRQVGANECEIVDTFSSSSFAIVISNVPSPHPTLRMRPGPPRSRASI